MLLDSINAQFKRVIFNDEPRALWSGCGAIIRAEVDDQHAVIKYSSVPELLEHPNIVQSGFARARKAKSYRVEKDFYSLYSSRLPNSIAIPELLWSGETSSENILVLRDFTIQGFNSISDSDLNGIRHIVVWLARFHATFLWCNKEPNYAKLWEQGGYWHLATRPDEHENIAQSDIKLRAAEIDEVLVNQRFRTLIHGDAKQANFAINQNRVVGYDFQYVGKGIGLQDIMLLFTSVFNADQQEAYEEPLLALYFRELYSALEGRFDIDTCQKIERQWRSIWPIIWSDFYRFLLGWKPNHFKINAYMKRQVNKSMSLLAGQS
ncbi:hypothetical protein PCIT_b0571 [Pseudoalteromonas citrea]|uniref:Aminoglycoside phosphotransferase domain-containing protein n=2 Tax=Pseudoalteromonas citrea TaxID=43655 RepID=A0AAD4AEK9_9GAMM|nr:phosphotransferase [Pseudoalteromonas citrea]KAF7764541.1 hypothetical protein PCIT_b0571 [Pseudoalteromonas citrea]